MCTVSPHAYAPFRRQPASSRLAWLQRCGDERQSSCCAKLATESRLADQDLRIPTTSNHNSPCSNSVPLFITMRTMHLCSYSVRQPNLPDNSTFICDVFGKLRTRVRPTVPHFKAADLQVSFSFELGRRSSQNPPSLSTMACLVL